MKTFSSIIAGLLLTSEKTTAIDMNNTNNTMLNMNNMVMGRHLGAGLSKAAAEALKILDDSPQMQRKPHTPHDPNVPSPNDVAPPQPSDEKPSKRRDSTTP